MAQESEQPERHKPVNPIIDQYGRGNEEDARTERNE
jgi:hypothetical protein